MQLNMQTAPQLKQMVTPELIQQLEVLQLSSHDLFQLIQEKVLENPLLQLEERQTETSKWKKSSNFMENPSNYTQEFTNVENPLTYLYEQIPLKQNLSLKQIHVLKYLIRNLDGHLFLDQTFEDLAMHLQVKVAEIKEMVYVLQQFEPFGTGCQNSIDFMCKQIIRDANAPKLSLQLIEHDLGAIAKKEIHALAKKYQVPHQEILRTIDYIKTLRPFPIENSNVNQATYVFPDIEIQSIGDTFIIQMDRQYLPKVTLNNQYIELLKGHNQYKDFFKETLKNARLFIQGIDEREKTLIKITRWLILEQKEFFNNGCHAIKPLNLKDAAVALDLHESTISRAIRDKYFLYKHQLYAYKELFPANAAHVAAKGLTSLAIKQMIRQVVELENTLKPLSDQQITQWMQQKGVEISRRTVTKYREEMLIPNSKKRKYF